MKRLLLVPCLFLFPLIAAAEADLVYRPQPLTGAPPAGPEEGIAVRTITIKRGDTLTKLSRRFNGKGQYFPQILLFNRIADPNLIYAGDSLRIPIRPGAATGESGTAAPSAQASPPASPVMPARPRTAAPQTASAQAEQLFAKAMASYQKGRYRTALDLFDRFLRVYPDSPHAADAMFHRGECYLKLSQQ